MDIEEDKNKLEIIFEKENLEFKLKFYQDRSAFINFNCHMIIYDKITLRSYSLTINPSSSSCGFAEIKAYWELKYTTTQKKKIIAEVLMHLPHIIAEYKQKENKRFIFMGLHFIIGGYLASSPGGNNHYNEVLKDLGFERIYTFINYNESTDHEHDFHFLKTKYFSKVLREQEIKYEVLFK